MDLTSPSTIVAAWLLVPLLVTVVSLALGLGVARLSGQALGALTVPTGFASGIVILAFLLQIGTSAGVAVAGTAVAAVAGAVAGLPAIRAWWARTSERRAAAWSGAVGLVAYSIGLLPLVGSGRLGVLGYVLNNDTAVHLSVVELLRRHGTGPYDVGASSLDWVGSTINGGYPIGSHVWVLFGRVATGVDALYLWTPLIALAGAMTALVGYSLLRRLAPAPVAAAGGLAAGCGYLPFSYLAQGGAKEVAIAFTVYLTVALFAAAVRNGFAPRTAVPVGISLAAAIAVIGVGAIAWIGPPALIALAVMLWRAPEGARGRIVLTAVLAGVIAGVAMTPALLSSLTFVSTSGSALEDPNQVGNLLGPVPVREAFNIWLNGDYRVAQPSDPTLTLIGWLIAAVLAAAGVWHAFRRREFGIVLAVLAGLSGVAVVASRYSIYFDAKTYMALAPALAIATTAGVVWLYRTSIRNQGLAIAIGAFLALAVLGSDKLVYENVRATPLDRFQELADINKRFAGQGPMLVNEREDYAKYLLRDVRPNEGWGAWTPDRGILETPKYNPRLDPTHTPDFDDYMPGFVGRFGLLLERRRPGGSRPPSNYRVVLSTAHYRVWRRSAPNPRDHLGLGIRVAGTAPLDCRTPAARRLFRLAGAGVRAALPAPRPVVVIPGAWSGASKLAPGPFPRYLVRLGGVGVAGPKLPAGTYTAYIQGAFGAGVRLVVAKRPVGDVYRDLGMIDAWQRFGTFSTTGGRANVALVGLGKPRWQAGSRQPDVSGPLAFVRQAPPRVELMSRTAARGLCGRPLDWIEAR